jgi:uncharacterized protein DUF6152
MEVKALALAGVIAAVPTIAAYAHHAFGRFDSEREITLQGTVKEFQWTSPHAWIMLTIDRRGRPEDWAIEMNGSSRLMRQGWQPRTLTPGMAVTTTVHPLRDGTNGGQFLEITLPDGTVLGRATTPSQ